MVETTKEQRARTGEKENLVERKATHRSSAWRVSEYNHITRDNGTRFHSGRTRVRALVIDGSRRRLYLIDEFDRQYKQLQRPIASVAKTRSAIPVSYTHLTLPTIYSV